MTVAQITVKVALQSFTCNIDGEAVLVQIGDIARSNHPVVRGRENLWGPLKIRFAEYSAKEEK